MNQGAGLELLARRIQATIGQVSEIPSLSAESEQLADALGKLVQTTRGLAQVAMTGEIEKYLANATPYLHLMGHVVMAWLWLEQGRVIEHQLTSNPEDAFLLGKRQALRYFYRWELPQIDQWINVLTPIDTSCLDMKPDWF